MCTWAPGNKNSRKGQAIGNAKAAKRPAIGNQQLRSDRQLENGTGDKQKAKTNKSDKSDIKIKPTRYQNHKYKNQQLCIEMTWLVRHCT